MTNKEKIKAYFDEQKRIVADYADYHSRMLKHANSNTRKHHENMAWIYGVSRPALYNDMERDLLKLV
jgi:hypothetical protein